jgi:phosphate transport system substrate-binding protein
MISICCAVSLQAGNQITIAGTGDSQELLGLLAKAYEKENPGKKIVVPNSIGSSGGIKATAKGKCDLGRVARYIKESEKHYNLKYKLFAYTPVVFATNNRYKGIDNLDYRQIIAIYSGQITEWKDIGSHSGKIYVAGREKGDSSRSILDREITGFKAIKNQVGKIIYNTPETARTIAKYDNTIGYVPLAMSVVHDLKVFKINGYAPSKENVLSGNYKLTVPLGLVWKNELQGLAKDFVRFITSPKGHRIISANGAIPVP